MLSLYMNLTLPLIIIKVAGDVSLEMVMVFFSAIQIQLCFIPVKSRGCCVAFPEQIKEFFFGFRCNRSKS